MTHKISLAMIARDRAKELARTLECVRGHVDEIVVVDAGGSVDDTPEVARRFGARVIEFLPKNHPEAFYDDNEETFSKFDIPGPYTGSKGLCDFSAPRKLSFDACTGDVIFWLDSDDVVRGIEHLRRIVGEMMTRDLESVFFQYEYEQDERGNCTVRQIRERIVRRSDYLSGKVRWEYPIHEHLHGLKRGGLFEDIVVVHQSPILGSHVSENSNLRINAFQRDKIAFRNLKCLMLQKERLEKDGKELPWRLAFYIGTEMRPLNPERAIVYLDDYLTKSGWDEERAQARYFIGQVREMQMRFEQAWDHFAGAALDFPGNPMPWFGLARIAFVRGEWDKVIDFTERGFAQVGDDIARKPSLVLNPLEWQYRAHLPYSRALIEKGRIMEALESCQKGLSVEPACPFLREHTRMIEDRMKEQKEAA